MNKDYAAQLLINASQVEADPELQLAMLMGARELTQDEFKWVPVDLRRWMGEAVLPEVWEATSTD